MRGSGHRAGDRFHGSTTVPGMAAALMLAASRLLASTERPEFGGGALAGVERAFRAERETHRMPQNARGRVEAGLGPGGRMSCFRLGDAGNLVIALRGGAPDLDASNDRLIKRAALL